MVQSVERTLDILEALADAKEDMSLSQLRDILDLPLGTVHRLLGTLMARGYAAQDTVTRHYGPGPKLLEIAARAAGNRRFNLTRIVRSALQELTAATGETSNLLVLRDNEGVYSEQVASPHLVRMFTEVGQQVPLYCTGGGKAILSGFTDEQLAAYLETERMKPWTAKTITNPELLRQEIEQARRWGFAIDDEEREASVFCVAAPIFDHTGKCIAAVSISGPTTRLSRDRAIDLGPRVRQAADECSAQLGYNG
ncbi:MAG: IclR family transcriptional regulator [Chloroflexales bacterium]|nr:IclR family transcriptional regulator [Chloroflexales bacterium]